MTCRNLGASSSFRRLFLRLRLSSEVAPLVWMGVRRDMMTSVFGLFFCIAPAERAASFRVQACPSVNRLFLHDTIQDTPQADRRGVQRAAQEESSGRRPLIEGQ